MTEDELDQRINEQIDSERVTENTIKLEIETLRKACDRVENVSGL